MTLSNLIRLSFILAFIGVFMALLSIAVPWVWNSTISDSRWQAAGQISSAVASIFGMLIASAALFAYLKTEEVGQAQANIAYQQKLKLEQAIHQYCFFFEKIMSAIPKAQKANSNIEQQYNFLILPSLIHLKDSLNEASKSDLYEALGSIRITQKDGIETNGGIELVYLHFHMKRMIDDNTVNINDNLLKKHVSNLIQALEKVKKTNIYTLIHEPLDRSPFRYMLENHS